MIDTAVAEFQSNYDKCEAIRLQASRTPQDELTLYQLLRTNGEILKQMDLEFAEAAPSKRATLRAQIEQLQAKHKDISKRYMMMTGGAQMDPTLDKNSRSANLEKIKIHEEKMNTLNEARRNMGEAGASAGDVQLQLERDFEMLAQQKDHIKLLGEDLVVSKDMMEKIKIQNRKSLWIFMAALGIPVLVVALAILVKIWRAGKYIAGS